MSKPDQVPATEYYIGLMSGTSLDGCDAALIACQGEQVQLLHFITLPMPTALKALVQDACSLNRSNVALICSLNMQLGQFFARAAKALCEGANFDIKKVTCIASHGQTVWHIPPPGEEGLLPSTLQLGEPAAIAYHAGVPVVAGMRAMDMAAGGQGAPMVPLSEFLLYRSQTEDIALQNLGGIGNVTVLPKNCQMEDVFAFDTGPANLILDGFAQQLFAEPYDRDGVFSAKGQVQKDLLSQWMAIPYIDAPIPKSTGRELFGEAFITEQLQKNRNLNPYDLIATAAAFTAESMARNYQLYVFSKHPDLKQIVLGGGGARNPTLKKMIAQAFPGRTILTQEDLGFNSDAKEAVAFALIGRQTMKHLPGNVPSATGAKQAVPLGSITWPPEYSLQK